MTARRRIRTHGGGGESTVIITPGVTANVAWGPNFGEADEWIVGVGVPPIDTVALDGTRNVQVNTQIPAVEWVRETPVTVGAQAFLTDLAATWENGLPTTGARLDGDLAFDMLTGFPQIRITPQLTDLLATYRDQSVGVNTALPEVALENIRTVGTRIVELEWSIASWLASKDAWVPVVALCPDNANKNGQDLQCDAIVATRKDIMIGWNVGSFPSNATVTSATLTMRLQAAPSVNGNLSLQDISSANESWSETTVVCNNIPAAGGVEDGQLTTTVGAGVDSSGAINSFGRSRMASRMGVGSFSWRIVAGTGVTAHTWESKDQGTNNALGPRLAMTFTTPT